MTAPKFVAYYRVSTDRQGRSGLGLDAQREIVRRFLDGTGGYPPVQEFVEVESGRKDDRAQLQAALSYCRLHRATLVIAKLDRLARSASFLRSLREQAARDGVSLRFCDFPDIPPGAAGWFMLEQMALVAEFEGRVISERTKAALAAKVARDGQWDRRAKHHLVPGAGQEAATEARKAKARQQAADLRAHLDNLRSEGRYSLRALADGLNERGIPTSRGGAWSATQVRRVLERLGAV